MQPTWGNSPADILQNIPLMAITLAYLITTTCFTLYKLSIKRRIFVGYKSSHESILAGGLLASAVILFTLEILVFFAFRGWGENLSRLDYVNLVAILALALLVWRIRARVDRMRGMHNIIGVRESSQYDLWRNFLAFLALAVLPIGFLTSDMIKPYYGLEFIFIAFAVIYILHDIGERVITLLIPFFYWRSGIQQDRRLPDLSRSYEIARQVGNTVEMSGIFRQFSDIARSSHLKIKSKIAWIYFHQSSDFWYREISGNLIKSTIHCWIAFVLLILSVGWLEQDGMLYEACDVFERQSTAKCPLTADEVLGSSSADRMSVDFGSVRHPPTVSNAVYIAAHEMFFNSSGVFPHGPGAKIVFFFMHLVGLFLYGLYLAFGVAMLAASLGERATRVTRSEEGEQPTDPDL